MNRVIVIQFSTLDGVVEDPDGSAGTPDGGWAFRHGPEAVAGDKFRLGTRLDTGGLLLGRRTWQLFARLWPGRSDEFSAKMNAAPKWVASRTLTDVDAWPHSALLRGELTAEVRRLRRERDVIVIGSTAIVHTLIGHDVVDEYRLLVFPTVLGGGRRLFPDGVGVGDLRLASVERSGAAALLCHERVGRQAGDG
ncbi:dihydrofolate reductase family protein [Micromonospora auratinigra]|uniref:Dihydrofolate reductase n=1 Tax=Micromonospora auratinigra TaxID=261654 RepID=A0A1A8ZNH2_9ACTN|nr:dihydrofolate reductase family protein [Micromonospora auratinigra]SBT45435.1 Dihydrofolate reductase [Micromonospora auratinigra]